MIQGAFYSPDYKEKAEKLGKRTEKIKPKRGDIYSDDGSLLATSISTYNLYMDPFTINKRLFESNIKALSDSLGVVLNKPKDYYEKKIRKARKEQQRYFSIAKNLTFHEKQRISKFPIFEKGKIKGGVIFERIDKRDYPMGEIGKRAIGYRQMNKDSTYNNIGLEGAFNKYLEGKEGEITSLKMNGGYWKPIYSSEKKKPEDGYDVVSTINISIQDIVHKSLIRQLETHKAKYGCAIVMDVKTGDVKAISNIRLGKNGEYYEDYNYAIADGFEPGSIFKPIVLAAAMEDFAIDTTLVIDTKQGLFNIHGRTITDSNGKGYGAISIAQAMEVSSNVAMAKLVEKYYSKSPKKLTNQFHKMGIDKQLGIAIIGEAKPYIPTPDSKHWHISSMHSYSFGYGLRLSPIQILSFYNAIANDGVVYKPQLIKQVKRQDKVIEQFSPEVLNNRICSPETAKKIRKVLENCVKNGTGKALYSPYFSMAGKTGTTRKNYNDKQENKEIKYISSFAGFFPAQDPKYSCIVVIHEPDKSLGYYGGYVSGPVFRDIAHKIYINSVATDTITNINSVYHSVEKGYKKYFEIGGKAKNIVPNVVGLPAMDAISILENLGLKVEISGQGNVVSQSLSSEQRIGTNTKIKLILE